MALRTITNPSTLTLDRFEIDRVELDPSSVIFSPIPFQNNNQRGGSLINRLYLNLVKIIKTPIHRRIHHSRGSIITFSSFNQSAIDLNNQQVITSVYENAIPVLSSSNSVLSDLRNPMIMSIEPLGIRNDTIIERRRHRIRDSLFHSLRRLRIPRSPIQRPMSPLELVSISDHYHDVDGSLLNDDNLVDVQSSVNSLATSEMLRRRSTRSLPRFRSIRRSLRRSIRTISRPINLQPVDSEELRNREQPDEQEDTVVIEARYYPMINDTTEEDTYQQRRSNFMFTFGRTRDIYKMLGMFEERYNISN